MPDSTSTSETACSAGRQLLLDVTYAPELFADVPANHDLISAGLNSGELIRLALEIEERTGVALDDDAVLSLATIDGIDEVLTASGGPELAHGREHG